MAVGPAAILAFGASLAYRSSSARWQATARSASADTSAPISPSTYRPSAPRSAGTAVASTRTRGATTDLAPSLGGANPVCRTGNPGEPHGEPGALRQRPSRRNREPSELDQVSRNDAPKTSVRRLLAWMGRWTSREARCCRPLRGIHFSGRRARSRTMLPRSRPAQRSLAATSGISAAAALKLTLPAAR